MKTRWAMAGGALALAGIAMAATPRPNDVRECIETMDEVALALQVSQAASLDDKQTAEYERNTRAASQCIETETKRLVGADKASFKRVALAFAVMLEHSSENSRDLYRELSDEQKLSLRP